MALRSFRTIHCVINVNRSYCSALPQSSGADDLGSSAPPSGRLSASDRRALIERIIRVDHAGELGADRIYAGQYCVLGKTRSGSLVKHMWEQEKEHLRAFERLIAKHRVRPTVLAPAWNVVGFTLGTEILGAVSAALGKEAAMACTVAVEESITQHYNELYHWILTLRTEFALSMPEQGLLIFSQIRDLVEDDPVAHADLLKIITKCRDEEMEHHDTGLEHDAEKAPMFQAMKFVIQTGCKGAIWLSERI